MNNFNLQSLQYILSVANNETPKVINEEGSELDVAKAIQYASQLFDINSTEFEKIMNAISLNKYCSLNALMLVNELNKVHDKQIAVELINKLIVEDIPSLVFRKSIARVCITCITNFSLLCEYKTYVTEELKLIQDSSINYVPVIFIN